MFGTCRRHRLIKGLHSEKALEAGAKFIVSPGLSVAVADACKQIILIENLYL